MEDNYHIVDFETHCPKCKHWETKDTDEPCDSCLSEPARIDSRRPIKYEEEKK